MKMTRTTKNGLISLVLFIAVVLIMVISLIISARKKAPSAENVTAEPVTVSAVVNIDSTEGME